MLYVISAYVGCCLFLISLTQSLPLSGFLSITRKYVSAFSVTVSCLCVSVSLSVFCPCICLCLLYLFEIVYEPLSLSLSLSLSLRLPPSPSHSLPLPHSRRCIEHSFNLCFYVTFLDLCADTCPHLDLHFLFLGSLNIFLSFP